MAVFDATHLQKVLNKYALTCKWTFIDASAIVWVPYMDGRNFVFVTCFNENKRVRVFVCLTYLEVITEHVIHLLV